MNIDVSKGQMAAAVAAALAAMTVGTTSGPAGAAKPAGTYAAGDFHNHTTCSDGSISMQKLVKKSTDKVETPWGLDWFVQAGHGGNGNRNCTLPEDATLATPAYPLPTFDPPANPAPPPATLSYPNTTWQNSDPPVEPKGLVNGTAPRQNMWRWQSVQEFQYPLIEYLNAFLDRPLFLGIESVVAGHEHSSMSVITGQIPASLDTATLPTAPPYVPLGSGTALAMWEYCFDRADTDTSRGNATVGQVPVPGGNNWDCSVPGSLNSADPSWNATAQKLIPAGGTGTGLRGAAKTIEALKWMRELHPETSYYVPAHLERAGPFNPNGNNGYNVDNLRNFNNVAPRVAFGFETQPGHGAADQRGEYTIHRNNIGGVNIDSVGGTTYGGTGVYGAQVGGVWDALLGEGRNWWFFASSDWHNRGSLGPDDRRPTFDFYPGEYQRNYAMVRNAGDKLRPQMIVDGLRSGNNWVAGGQIIDRLAFVACASYRGFAFRSNAAVESIALDAAKRNTDIDVPGCATMGEKLVVRPGAEIVVSIVVRDPAGTNYSPYSFPNPSLLQIGIEQPLNQPVLDHVDVIGGNVTGFKDPNDPAAYAGAWPSDWINPYLSGGAPSLESVPPAAKNTSTGLLHTFNAATWGTGPDAPQFKTMTFRIPAVQVSQYVRLRGTNMPPSVPYETDANGNPLPDVFTNAAAIQPSTPNAGDGAPANFYLRIPCTTQGTNVPANTTPVPAGAPPIDGCPNHLPVKNGQKYSAYDVAAWSDLWFYSNPIYIEVGGSTLVAGVK
jgi:hypothetical protein